MMRCPTTGKAVSKGLLRIIYVTEDQRSEVVVQLAPLEPDKVAKAAQPRVATGDWDGLAQHDSTGEVAVPS